MNCRVKSRNVGTTSRTQQPPRRSLFHVDLFPRVHLVIVTAVQREHTVLHLATTLETGHKSKWLPRVRSLQHDVTLSHLLPFRPLQILHPARNVSDEACTSLRSWIESVMLPRETTISAALESTVIFDTPTDLDNVNSRWASGIVHFRCQRRVTQFSSPRSQPGRHRSPSPASSPMSHGLPRVHASSTPSRNDPSCCSICTRWGH